MRYRHVITLMAVTITFACADDASIVTDPDSRTQSGPPSHAVGDQVISSIQVVDLGTLPGGVNSEAADINDAGDIVGSSETTSGQTHAFILIGSAKTDLGTLPGGDLSSASGLNSLRQVVGNARNAAGVIHGFMWQGGVMRDLGAYPPEDAIGSSSVANAINDAGFIAGSIDLAGVVWDLAGVPNFPPFPPAVAVTAAGPFQPAISSDINNAGQVVGTLLAPGLAFRWESGMLTALAGLGIENRASGINGLGQAVGSVIRVPPSVPAPRRHAAFWPNLTTVQDLGTLGGETSAAFDLNNDGLIVGQSQTSSGDIVAFVWREDLGMHSLGTLGGPSSEAFAINTAGQIVGRSSTSTGAVHAALWTLTFATVIAIDVIPSVNPRNHGVVPVVIVSTADFDATSIDPLSVRFGPNRAPEAHGRGHIADANADGRNDLVLHFRTEESGIQCGDSEAILTGQTLGGSAIQGSDSIKTVGCK